MNIRVKPRIALILMIFVGGLVIYIGSTFGFKPPFTKSPNTERCSEINAEQLNNQYNFVLNQQATVSSRQKAVLLKTLSDLSAFSDCRNVISQTVTVSKRLVSLNLPASQQLEVVYALLHTLENAQGGFEVSITEYREATSLAEYFLRLVDTEALAGDPESLKRYQDLTQMMAVALESTAPDRAKQWKPKLPPNSPNKLDDFNTKPPNRRDAQ